MKIFLLFIAILVVSCEEAVQNSSDNAILEQKIKKLDLAHAQAIFEGDAIALDSLMSDDITVNHPTNRIVNDKKKLLSLIDQGVIRYSAFERNPKKFLFFENMVVVMGRELVVPAEGAPNAGKKLQRRYTNIWMKNKNKWQLTVRHAHNVCASFSE